MTEYIYICYATWNVQKKGMRGFLIPETEMMKMGPLESELASMKQYEPNTENTYINPFFGWVDPRRQFMHPDYSNEFPEDETFYTEMGIDFKNQSYYARIKSDLETYGKLSSCFYCECSLLDDKKIPCLVCAYLHKKLDKYHLEKLASKNLYQGAIVTLFVNDYRKKIMKYLVTDIPNNIKIKRMYNVYVNTDLDM